MTLDYYSVSIKPVTKLAKKYYFQCIFLLSWFSTIGSLYISEIARIEPCVLCWYQRIFMYPIALVSTIALLRKDKNGAYYILGLSFIGTLIALYHNILQKTTLFDTIETCTIGVSCKDLQSINYLGFITIPFMSLIGFLAIFAFSVYYIKRIK